MVLTPAPLAVGELDDNFEQLSESSCAWISLENDGANQTNAVYDADWACGHNRHAMVAVPTQVEIDDDFEHLSERSFGYKSLGNANANETNSIYDADWVIGHCCRQALVAAPTQVESEDGFERLSEFSFGCKSFATDGVDETNSIYDADWVCQATDMSMRLKDIIIGILVDSTMATNIQEIVDLVSALKRLGFQVALLFVDGVFADVFQSLDVLSASAPTPKELLQALPPSVALCTRLNVEYARQYEKYNGCPAVSLSFDDEHIVDSSEPWRPSLCIRDLEDAEAAAASLKDYVLTDIATGKWQIAFQKIHPSVVKPVRLSKARRDLEHYLKIGCCPVNVKYAVQKCTKDTMREKDEKGNTILQFFVSTVRPTEDASRIAILLIAMAGRLDVRNKSGESALQLATRSAIEVLKSDRNGLEVPTHERLGVVWNLLLGRADPNCTDHNRETPLMEAARVGDFSLCRMLLNFGAASRLTNSRGATAINMAASHPRTMSLFDKRGPPEVSPEVVKIWSDMQRLGVNNYEDWCCVRKRKKGMHKFESDVLAN